MSTSRDRAAKKAPIRVLLVDDSPVALAILQRTLERSGEVEVIGTAKSGIEALAMIPELDPAVVCTDLHMPDMDGLELTQHIVTDFPRPVLVVSASTQPEDTHTIFKVLEAGAIDVMPKPKGGSDADYEAIAAELIGKIKVLAGVFVFRRRTQMQSLPPGRFARLAKSLHPRMIVIGASTGGPQALLEIFSALPSDYSIPILCIQHISADFLAGFVEWLQSQCRITIRIATAGEVPQPGTIYMPREGTHLEIDREGRFAESLRAAVDGHRPSVTVGMTSASRYFGGDLVGILLSGMGRDGAAGMRAIADAGGITIAQDEASSIVFGMPKQAIELGAVRFVLNPGEIVRKLLQLQSAE